MSWWIFFPLDFRIVKMLGLPMTHQDFPFKLKLPFIEKENHSVLLTSQSEEDKHLQEELTMLVERLSVSYIFRDDDCL